MNIVMLGHSGAGKTTYVSLMYREMQNAIAGFQVRAEKDKHHKQLMRAGKDIVSGRYPDPTHQRASFDFVLLHDREPVFPFTWRDYRGGALSDRSSSPDVAKLHEDLRTADGIVVFVDAVSLLTDRRATRDIRRIVTHVQRALDARGDVLTPLVLGITKCDLVDLDAPGADDLIVDPFGPLIEAVGETRHVHGVMLPLVCGPQPQNVVVPVLWALRFGILGIGMQLQTEIEFAARSAADAAARDTIGDRFRSWWNDEPSYASISRDYQEQLQDRLRLLEPLIPPAEQLDALLADLSSF